MTMLVRVMLWAAMFLLTPSGEAGASGCSAAETPMCAASCAPGDAPHRVQCQCNDGTVLEGCSDLRRTEDPAVPGVVPAPMAAELKTIVNCSFGNPCVNPIFEPTAGSDYWSAATFASGTGFASPAIRPLPAWLPT